MCAVDRTRPAKLDALLDELRTIGVKAGGAVTHFGKEVHYDGAKDEEVIVLITGEGPATNTPVEMAP